MSGRSSSISKRCLVAEMVIQAVSVIGGGGVPVMYDEDVSEVVVQVDKRRFGRVIANLLDNAEKYAGGATRRRPSTRVDDAVQIAVEDDGPGVPEEERDRIFDRFSRGSESGNALTDSGVGLGLALVDEHVRLHGGRVWVEDRRGEQVGARFVVELPMVEVAPTVAVAIADDVVRADMIRRVTIVVAAVLIGAAACGIRSDDEPRSIPKVRCRTGPRTPRTGTTSTTSRTASRRADALPRERRGRGRA